MHWTYDTYALAHAIGGALLKRGADTWFFITADYAFGHALERDAMAVVKGDKGRVLGAIRHPQDTPDLSSFLLQAQASGAKVIALALEQPELHAKILIDPARPGETVAPLSA